MSLQVIMKGSIEKLSDSKQIIKQLLLYFVFICVYVYMFVPLRSQRTVFESLLPPGIKLRLSDNPGGALHTEPFCQLHDY